MNDWAVLLSALMGRDVSREVAALAQCRAALGSALSVEQQLFVSEHWRDLHVWLGTDAGRDAARLVVDEWMGSARPALGQQRQQ